MIEELAEVLGAATVAQNQFLIWGGGHSEHVGQTGKPASIFMAIGISGAIQHLAEQLFKSQISYNLI